MGLLEFTHKILYYLKVYYTKDIFDITVV